MSFRFRWVFQKTTKNRSSFAHHSVAQTTVGQEGKNFCRQIASNAAIYKNFFLLYFFCHTLSLYLALSFLLLLRRFGVVTCTDTQNSRLLIDLGVGESERGKKGGGTKKERESQAGEEREGGREREKVRECWRSLHTCVCRHWRHLLTSHPRCLSELAAWRRCAAQLPTTSAAAEAKTSVQSSSEIGVWHQKRDNSSAARNRKTCQHQITLRQKRIVIKTRKTFSLFSFVCF